ncbi:hypothetical protein ES703_65788 [subsurface metagenome]
MANDPGAFDLFIDDVKQAWGDEVEIQAAIDAMGAGTVELLEGTFNIYDTIVIDGKTITLEGQGMLASRLLQKAAVDIVEFKGSITFPIVRDLDIQGDHALATGNGITVTGDLVLDLIVRDIFVWYMPGLGIYVPTGGWGHVYDNVILEYCKGIQLQINAGARIKGCKFGANELATDKTLLYLGSANITTDCQFFASKGTGVGEAQVKIQAGNNIFSNNSFFNIDTGTAAR